MINKDVKLSEIKNKKEYKAVLDLGEEKFITIKNPNLELEKEYLAIIYDDLLGIKKMDSLKLTEKMIDDLTNIEIDDSFDSENPSHELRIIFGHIAEIIQEYTEEILFQAKLEINKDKNTQLIKEMEAE